MSEPAVVSTDVPEPAKVRTRQDFAHALTLLRERAGRTVRQVATATGVQGTHSTIGDWFAGRGLPSTSSRDLLVRVLTACGVDDAGEVEQWLRAWRRVRRAPGPRAGGPEPYRGLASFQPEESGWFFGREELTGQLIARVGDLRAAGGGLLGVVGASGSGKSSLLRAGLVAALRAGRLPGSSAWPVVLFTPGARPMEELAARLDDGAAQPLPVLVVDQFEELFTACAENEQRHAFIAALAASAADGAVVVVGLRADFYARALRHPDLVAAMQANQITVGPMSDAQLRAAIVEPAHKAKLDLEDGLVELLLRDVAPHHGPDDVAHDAGILPLLSHALYATWHHGSGRRMAIADYRAVGGIAGAVAATADKVYDALDDAQRELARRLFLTLVHVAPDTADTRRRVSTANLIAGSGAADTAAVDTAAVDTAAVENVLDRFIAERLITADADTVEISHEALVTAWPQLRAWLDTDRAGLVVGRHLSEAAAAWRREQRDPAALYRGARLAAAREWAETAGPTTGLNPPAREFLQASADRELAEQRLVRRRTRRLQQLAAGLAAALLLTAAATVVAIGSLRTTRTQRNVALSGKVANEATALRPVNPALAAHLSLAAYRLAPTTEARGSLLSTFGTAFAVRLTGHTGYVYATAFSPDGRTLATTSTDRTLRLWDVGDPHRPALLATPPGHTAGVLTAVFRPDGHILATAGDDRTVRLWDVTDPRHPITVGTVTGHQQAIKRAAFSPDGRTLATAGFDHTARLWDVTDPRRPSHLATIGQAEGFGTVVFGRDGRTLVTAGANNPTRLWDVTNPRHPQQVGEMTGHTERVLTAQFSPDGHILATGAFDNSVRLWNVTDPSRPTLVSTLSGHRDGVASIAFSPDKRTLATGSYDATVRLWDITDPRAVSAPVVLSGHAEAVYSVAFSPDGRFLASGSRDNTARLWDTGGGLVSGHRGPVTAVAVSPDGRVLATGSHRAIRLWDIRDPERPAPLSALSGHTDGVDSLAFNADGRILASGSLDFTARLWDVTDPGHPAPLSTLVGHTNNVFTVRFGANGQTLVTGGADETIRVWDIGDPRHPRVAATLPEPGVPVFAAGVSPDGRVLATRGPDATVKLWDLTNPGHPKAQGRLAGHTNAVFALAFHPRGRILATGGLDATLRLWDVADPRRPALLATLAGHTNAVNSVAFSTDGRNLVSGSSDRTVRLWDVTDPRHPKTPVALTGHADEVIAVAIAPDGSTVATGGADATARLWRIDIDHTVAKVCAFAHPGITKDEWGRYFADLPYRPSCT